MISSLFFKPTQPQYDLQVQYETNDHRFITGVEFNHAEVGQTP